MSERHGAAALRAELERSFAAPLAPPLLGEEAYLVVRVRSQVHALPVAALAGVHHGRLVVSVPGPEPTFLGLAGLRGALVPVYDLGGLLGLPPPDATPRWLAVARGAAPVALAFDELEAHVSTRADGDVVHAAGKSSPLLDVPRLLGELARRFAASKES